MDWIKRYWIQELFTLIIAVVTWLWHQILKQRKEKGMLKEGIVALLHSSLYEQCQFYLDRGYCTLDDRDNLEYIYRPYKELGGNGTGEELYNRCLKLPYRLEEEK